MCSKEPSHYDGSFEYPQHMFGLRNKKNNCQLHARIFGPAFGNIYCIGETEFSNLHLSIHSQWH